MSNQTSFRSVIKPLRKEITSNIGSTLDFEDKYTIIDFNASQGSNITTLVNIAHLIDGQTIAVFNTAATDVNFDASLMMDNKLVDIEPGTTAFFYYDKSSGKLIDQGGTARIKNIEEDFAAHNHDGSNSNKVLATDLDVGTTGDNKVLTTDSGNAIWKDFLFTSFRAENTDTTTNLNDTTSYSTKPLVGNVTHIDSIDFEAYGTTGFKTKFTGRVKITSFCPYYSPDARINVQIRTLKNGTPIGTMGNGYIRDYSGQNEATSSFVDEFDCVDGDIFEIGFKREGNSGTATFSTSGCAVLLAERTGGPRINGGQDYNLADLKDTTITNPENDSILVYQNGKWVNQGGGSITEYNTAIFPIWAEENGGLDSNTAEWSFGNGAVGDTRIVLPIDCTLFAVSFQAETMGASDSVSIDVKKNGATATTPLFQNKTDYVNLSTEINFTAGDSLSFSTNTETGSITDARVCAWFKVKTKNESIAYCRNTDTTTNLNIVETSDFDTIIPIAGSTTVRGSFTSVTDGIQCDFDGEVEVKSHLHLKATKSGSTDTRAAVEFRILKNGTSEGAIGCVNINQDNSTNVNSSSLSDVITVNNGDVIKIGARKASDAPSTDTVTMSESASCNLLLRRL